MQEETSKCECGGKLLLNRKLLAAGPVVVDDELETDANSVNIYVCQDCGQDYVEN